MAYNPARINVGSIGLFKEGEGKISSLYVLFSCTKNIYPDYMYEYMKSSIFHKQILARQEGGVRSYFFYENFAGVTINFPSLKEQTKIVDFISSLNKKIKVLSNKLEALKKYKKGIMIKCYQSVKNQPISLSKLVKSKTILLGRGEIIPKQNGTFPVYSSSTTNNGLFCFRNKYSFNEELITWSIDGGGKPFLRNKHKFSITNVCGYAKILDLSRFSYSWLYINFWNSWRKIKFDYTAKAHPSVIEKLYKIKPLDIESQMKVEKILTYVNYKIDYLIKELNDATLIKESMLRLLFI